ncbi:MAG: ABC transporter ATP-binding protein [Calditrichaeota bacterium]|nr:MAG: ABC transporter ATP-binding protein [Calditrichota bacterium]
MLTIHDLTYTIGDRVLLNAVNLAIRPGKRIGLVGRNGAGKTTLLRLITGKLEADSGAIRYPSDYRIGFLPQEELAFTDTPILELALQGQPEILRMEKEIHELHQRPDLQDNPALLKRLGVLEELYRGNGGYDLEFRARKILSGLGFSDDQFHHSIQNFSGGWRMRVYLARLLLLEPDLLILDEPTNHLDMDSLLWLEQFLTRYNGSLLIVSHDRYFLERVVNEIAEITKGQLTHYSGGYDFYLKKRAENLEMLKKAYARQQETIAHTQKFIDRFRYKASKAAQVQSRIKQLEKMERIELPEEENTLRFTISVDTPSFKHVLTLEHLWFAYAQPQWVLRDLNLSVTRGERIALVGANGAGKTTFTRLLSGELQAQKGTLTIGERVSIGYYAQHQTQALDLNKTVLQEVEQSAAASFRPRLRDILGLFQFSGDDVNKNIRVLSGGEKARVSLAKMLLSPANFLIMDEPTNHLDVPSREALEHALDAYNGTLLLISHDRYFLDKLVDRVWLLENGVLTEYTGRYSSFLEKRARESQQSDIPTKPAGGKPARGTGNRKSKEQKRLEAQARQSISKERKRLTRAIEEVEKQLETLEEERADVENQLADPATYQNAELSATLHKRYKKLEQHIHAQEHRWETMQMELEKLLEQLKENT